MSHTVFAVSLSDLGGILTGIAALIALPAALYGVRQYRDQTRERRGRWLNDLAARFAQDESFQRVRSELYKGDQSDLTRALQSKSEARAAPEGSSASLTEGELKLLVALDDYLDFFGLIEHLINENELDERDADTLFSWYVGQAISIDVVREEIGDYFASVAHLHERFTELAKREAA